MKLRRDECQLKVWNQSDLLLVEEYPSNKVLIGRELGDMKRLTPLPLPAVVRRRVMGRLIQRKKEIK